MMAEKIADVIRGRMPEPRSEAVFFQANGAPARRELRPM
jgi:choline dehydrogenase